MPPKEEEAQQQNDEQPQQEQEAEGANAAAAAAAAAAAPKAGMLEPQLVQSSRLCARCAAVKAADALTRCQGCGNVFYCDATCQKMDWADHKGACRDPLGFCAPKAAAGAFKFHRTAWAVVLPAGQELKPFAVLLPAAKAEALPAVRELVRGSNETVHLQADVPVRGGNTANDHVDTMVFWARDDAADGAPNPRASTIVSELDFAAALPNLLPVAGPRVKVKGAAVVVRYGAVFAGLDGVEQLHDEPLRDFGLKDYEARWGIFSMVGGLSADADEAMCIVMPDDANGQAQMSEMVQALNEKTKR
jgi:hypothetical protein